MMTSKKMLKFFIKADMMMNKGKFSWSLTDRIKHLVAPDYIMQYLKSLRYCQYYATPGNRISPHFRLLWAYHRHRYQRLGLKLGFSIGYSTLGYGVVLPHYGTIVVGVSNRIGNYAVLFQSTCISDNGKRIGNGLYLATGAVMTSTLTLGDNVSVGANSVVNRSFGSNLMIAGAPAREIKQAAPWYVRDGRMYAERVEKVEQLKNSLISEDK